MPSFSSKLVLSTAASTSNIPLADIDAIRGAFKVYDAYADMTNTPVSLVSNNQIVWCQELEEAFQATVTYANPPFSFTDTLTWSSFTGFGGGGGGDGDITAVLSGNGLIGGATSGIANLSVGQGDGITVSSTAVQLDTGSNHFISGVIDLNIFKQVGSYYSTTNELQVTGSLTLRKDDSGDALSVYSGSVKTFGITESGLLNFVSQSSTPTAVKGGVYFDTNYDLFIGQE